ncbi:MAG: hypothetical protein M3N54_09180, partial [Acidobacteriota bacterium]|nr:hypothetical protein [Acidobacteriota bacterium]
MPLILLVCADFPVAAQFGSPYPGVGGGIGSPGGSIGGLPFPGNSRRRNTQNGPTETLTGTLRRVSMSQFVLDPGDGRNITVSIERTTRFIDITGGNGKLGDFDMGDQVSIDASRDNQNYYHAVRVSLQQKAATASDPKGDQKDQKNDQREQPSAPATTSSNDDPDRPRLKRSAGSSSDSAADTPRAQITTADPVVDAPMKPVPREADDPGPPKLRRGAAARVDKTPPAGSEPDTIASARPSIKAEDVNGVTRRQAPPVISTEDSVSRQASDRAVGGGLTSTDPVIQGAREAAVSFTESLPNYVVKQFTARYQSDS